MRGGLDLHFVCAISLLWRRLEGISRKQRSFTKRRRTFSGRSLPAASLRRDRFTGLATVIKKTGRLPQAEGLFERAVQAFESQTAKLGGAEEVRTDFAALYVDAYYRDYIDLLLEMKKPAHAFHVLERSRARSLLTMLAERALTLADDMPTDLARERKLIDADY